MQFQGGLDDNEVQPIGKNTKQFEKKSIIYGIDIDVNYGIDIDNGCLGEYGTRLKREKREKRLKKRLRIRFQTQQQKKESNLQRALSNHR